MGGILFYRPRFDSLLKLKNAILNTQNSILKTIK